MPLRPGLPALWLVCLALVALACASRDAAAPRFANATMGIASNFSDVWEIHTDRASAPEAARAQFPPHKGPDESPLLLAIRRTSDAFARVLVEPVPRSWDAATYFDALHRALAPVADTLEVAQSAGDDAVRWSYKEQVAATDLVFLETVTVRAGYGIRIGFWTHGSLMPTFREEFETLTDAWRFRDEEGRWKARWSGLTRRLSSEGFEHIALTRPGHTRDGCAVGERQRLYEVTGPRGKLYLFGSVHFGHPDYYPLPEAIEDAYASSSSLLVEFDITDFDTQREVAFLMADMGALPEGEHVRDHLEADTYRALEEAFARLGIPIRSFTGLKPWALAMVLSDLKLQSQGYLPRYGVDRYFLERAGPREIVDIETPREQLGLLDALDGELFLALTLLGFESAAPDMEEIERAWLCGDEAALESLLLRSREELLPGSDEMNRAFFDDRNERMAAAAARRLEKPGEHFMVVGAGHLVGERGIPALLREQGFEVLSK